jgi:hypothetical protein
MSWIPIAIAAGSAAYNIGSNVYKTSADKKRNEELERMQALEESGDWQTPEEKAWAEQYYMEPVRTMAKEDQMRTEAQMAQYGQKGGQLFAERQRQQERLDQAGQRAGQMQRQDAVTAEKEGRRYIDQLIADRAIRRQKSVENIGRSVGDIAEAYGQYRGSEQYYADQPAEPDYYVSLRKRGWSEADIQEFDEFIDSEFGGEIPEGFMDDPSLWSEEYL